MRLTIDQWFAEGRKAERAAIVAWLRAMATEEPTRLGQLFQVRADTIDMFADAIERRDHLNTSESPNSSKGDK